MIYNIISLCAVLALIVYIIIFEARYKTIPQSLSVTAEYPSQYYYWQCTICTIFGWLAFYFPVVYTYAEYSYWPLLLNAGCSGLALAGYYSYSSAEETKRLLFIHKVGSFSGAICVCLFYMIFGNWIFTLSTLAICLLLGMFIKGHRYKQKEDNSIVFFMEIAIVIIVSSDIITRFISMF